MPRLVLHIVPFINKAMANINICQRHNQENILKYVLTNTWECPRAPTECIRCKCSRPKMNRKWFVLQKYSNWVWHYSAYIPRPPQILYNWSAHNHLQVGVFVAGTKPSALVHPVLSYLVLKITWRLVLLSGFCDREGAPWSRLSRMITYHKPLFLQTRSFSIDQSLNCRCDVKKTLVIAHSDA